MKKNNQEENDTNQYHKSIKHKGVTSMSLSFDHFSKMLLSLNLIPLELSNEHKICLEFPSIEIDLMKSEDIGGSSMNNNTLSITSKLCSYEIKISSLFKLYKSLGHKEQYSFEDFKILMQIFSSILSGFNDALFKFDLSKDLITDHSPPPQLNTIEDNDLKQAYKDRMDSMYTFLKGITDLYSKNLLYLICVFSLFGDISYLNFSLDAITKNTELYSRIYMSDIKLFLLIHFHVVVLVNITIKKLSIDKFLASSGKKKNEDKHVLNSYVPTIYFIDNYSNERLTEKGFQRILLSSIIKYYLLPYIESSGLGLNISFNLTILSYEALRWLCTNSNSNDNDNDNGNGNGNGNNTHSQSIQTTLSKEMLLTSNQLIELINEFDINEFNMILDHSFSPSTVSCILSPYLDIIINSKLFNAETEKLTQALMLQYENYISELDMLIGVLKFNLKVKKAKKKRKSLSKSYSFHFSFNSFDVTIKKDLSIKDNHIRSIIVFLSQKHFNEEDMVNHISKRGGLTIFYNEFRKIMSEFQYFKKYSIGIRVSQNRIINEQLQYYFGIVYLQLQHYLTEHIHSHRNVVLHEAEAISPQHTIAINSIVKHKEKLTYYHKYAKKFELSFVSLLNQYITTLIDCFDDIVIHYVSHEKKYPFNPRVLMRSFNENILIIVTDAIYIDFIVYMHENEHSKEYHEKIMDWIQSIRVNPDIMDLIRNITVVMTKQCLAEKDYYNTDAHLKRFLSDVNTLYLIDKEYDLILQEKKMIIYNRDSGSDTNTNGHGNQLVSFINIIRNCYDTIQYVISNQLREYNNFGYVSNRSKYLLQFKGGSMSLRKITAKGFTSLFVLDPFRADNSYPILNAMTGKSNSDFSFINLLKLFKNLYLKMEEVTNANVLNILHKEILNDYYSDITLLFLKLKYYNMTKSLLGKAVFGNIIFYPIKLNKMQLEFDDPFICREITLFQFENTKLNFYSNNDMGTMFSLQKTEETLSYLKSNASSYTKSKRRVMIDYLITVLWVLKRYIKNEHGNHHEKIMKTLFSFMIQREEFSKEGMVNRYVVDFNTVANEVRKCKKKAKKINEDNKMDLNENRNSNANDNIIHQSSTGKRKGRGSVGVLRGGANSNEIQHDKNANVIYRTNSGKINKKHTTRKLNKNCAII